MAGTVENALVVEEEYGHVCPICGREVDELRDCACLPCEDCGLIGDASCIEDHDHIPDPVLIRVAAQERGVRTDVVYRWARNGWILSRKSADTRTAPVLVSAWQVFHFQPPKRGWPRGVPKCPVCGKALTAGHREHAWLS